MGVALALLGTAVLWSSRAFPAVPGQKVGAGFLPGLVGVGLMLCGVLLVLRSGRVRAEPVVAAELGRGAGNAEHYGPAAVVIGACVFYILLADVVGFLIVAPLALLAVFKVLHVRWGPSLLWSLGGTLVVHIAFYKLLRVPLPWGLLRPLY